MASNAAALAPSVLTAESRFGGALIGLAVGDALGGSVEFKQRGSFPAVREMLGGGPHNLKPGEWTDDTSMALCLAESLIEKQALRGNEWVNVAGCQAS